MQVKAKMREYFDRDYCQRLIMLVDAIYPDLMSNIGHAIEPLSAEEIMLACMHFLNFPNKVIGAYLGYTSKFSISHKKSEVAAKVLGENAKIQQLAMPR